MSIAVHVDDVHEDTIVAKNLTQEHVRIHYTLSVLIGTVVSIGDCFVIVDSIFGIENGCIDQIDLRYEGNIPYSSVRRSFKNKKESINLKLSGTCALASAVLLYRDECERQLGVKCSVPVPANCHSQLSTHQHHETLDQNRVDSDTHYLHACPRIDRKAWQGQSQKEDEKTKF